MTTTDPDVATRICGCQVTWNRRLWTWVVTTPCGAHKPTPPRGAR